MPHTGEEIYPAPDFVQLALAAELISAPGEEFSYNNKAVNLLSGVVERCSGQPLDEYLRDHLFNELGIERFQWTRDRCGNPHGMSGLQIAPKDLLKIGRLVLNDGSWEGRQVLSSEWLGEALSAQGSPNCGFLWWRIPRASVFAVERRSVETFIDKTGAEDERKLVIVRMIGASDDYNPDTDSFSQLQETLRTILTR